MPHSFTADVTSNGVVKSVQDALASARESATPDRLSRIDAVAKTISNLRERGLLKQQEYRTATAAEFEQRYAIQR